VNTRFTSAAEAELQEAIAFYEAAENGLGARFLDELAAVVARILAHPTAWTPMSPRTRRCRTHRFPYGLFYQIRADEILIVSVMDLRRDPKRWEQYLL
jgi:plasmid stabilization system protein ParE